MERLRTEEASKALLGGVEGMVREAMYPMTLAETEKLKMTLGWRYIRRKRNLWEEPEEETDHCTCPGIS